MPHGPSAELMYQPPDAPAPMCRHTHTPMRQQCPDTHTHMPTCPHNHMPTWTHPPINVPMYGPCPLTNVQHAHAPRCQRTEMTTHQCAKTHTPASRCGVPGGLMLPPWCADMLPVVCSVSVPALHRVGALTRICWHVGPGHRRKSKCKLHLFIYSVIYSKLR